MLRFYVWGKGIGEPPMWHLKGIENENYNEEGLEMAKLQNDEMLECLKATNGYASRNVLKRCHNMINDAPNSRIKHLYL